MNQSTRYITSIRSVNPDCKFFPSQGVVTASSSPRSPNQNQDWSIRRPRNKKHTRKSAKSHEFEHVFFGEEVKKENHHFFCFCWCLLKYSYVGLPLQGICLTIKKAFFIDQDSEERAARR